MQPSLVREPFDRPGWIYEEKYDGWRMLAFKEGERVRLVSRNGVDRVNDPDYRVNAVITFLDYSGAPRSDRHVRQRSVNVALGVES